MTTQEVAQLHRATLIADCQAAARGEIPREWLTDAHFAAMAATPITPETLAEIAEPTPQPANEPAPCLCMNMYLHPECPVHDAENAS